MVYFNLFSKYAVFQNYNGVAAIRIVVEFEETDRDDVEILLVSETYVAIGFWIVVSDSITFDFPDQVGVVDDAWFGAYMVGEVTPLTHPLD